jgi:hypothetical protein
MRGVIWLLLLAGCDQVFPIAHFDPATCGSGFTAISGAPYRYSWFDTDLTWGKAEQACEAARLPGGAATHLIVLDDEAEQKAVMGTVADQLNQEDIWTGLVQESDGMPWVAITGGTPAWIPWATGDNEPYRKSDGTDPRNAGAIVFDHGIPGQLADQPFDYGDRYVCECDGRDLVPPFSLAP